MLIPCALMKPIFSVNSGMDGFAEQCRVVSMIVFLLKIIFQKSQDFAKQKNYIADIKLT